MKYVVTLFLFSFVHFFGFSQSLPNMSCHEIRTMGFDVQSYNREYVDWVDITIPVVFHIFHNGEDVGTYPNISVENINFTVDYINESFAGQNNDYMVDSKIRFCLSSDDGIVRYNADTISFFNGWGTFDGTNVFDTYNFFNQVKDNLITDFNKLNIVIAPWNSPISGLGGSQPNNNNYGGIAINSFHYNYMEYDNILGTFNHEIGHYFNLRHTFHNTETCEDAYTESDCENEGDYVCDTPPHTQIIDLSYNECYDIDSYEHEVLSTNAMSYSSNLTGFTIGQIDRMQSHIQNTNMNLVASNYCVCNELEDYECLCTNECHYDLDDDDIVALGDLLEFLTIIFNDGNCQIGDFDNSGYIDTLDLLDLLSVMGNECE